MAFVPDPVQPDVSPSSMRDECTFPGCTNLIEYSGRGRKPTKCEEHKKAANVSVRKTGNEKLAAQAATVLAQGNTFFAIVLRFGIPYVGKFPMTAEALTDDDLRTEFIDAATTALETDPALCRLIINGGFQSSRWALAMAYGAMLSKLAPVMMADYAIQRAQRKDAEAAY